MAWLPFICSNKWLLIIRFIITQTPCVHEIPDFVVCGFYKLARRRRRDPTAEIFRNLWTTVFLDYGHLDWLIMWNILISTWLHSNSLPPPGPDLDQSICLTVVTYLWLFLVFQILLHSVICHSIRIRIDNHANIICLCSRFFYNHWNHRNTFLWQILLALHSNTSSSLPPLVEWIRRPNNNNYD